MRTSTEQLFCRVHLCAYFAYNGETTESGLILDYYCRRYLHAMPLLNFLVLSNSIHFHFEICLGARHLPITLKFLEYSFFIYTKSMTRRLSKIWPGSHGFFLWQLFCMTRYCNIALYAYNPGYLQTTQILTYNFEKYS